MRKIARKTEDWEWWAETIMQAMQNSKEGRVANADEKDPFLRYIYPVFWKQG